LPPSQPIGSNEIFWTNLHPIEFVYCAGFRERS
jgi:hypothetical protein